MNVLSLFDGISCGRLALERVGTKVNNYYASEIDKYAIQISKNNWPEIIQLGDVRNIDFDDKKIDLLLAGSPCTNLSFGGKQEAFITKCGIVIKSLAQYRWLKLNDYEFVGESYLFWEFVDILEIKKPNYFLLENVPMKKEHLETITNAISEAAGVKVCPVVINSALVSAQTRKRYYWTNIPNVTQPEDKKIFLKDILETDGDCINYSSSGRGKNGVESRISEALKSYTITKTGFSKRSFTGVSVYHLPHGFNKGGVFCREKMPTLRKDTRNNYFLISGEKFRKLTITEMERLQNLPDDYTTGPSENQRSRAIGNGWPVDAIAHILKGLSD